VPLIASVETVVAAVLGVALFREAFGIAKLLGIALVLGSVAISNPSKKEA
jgi:drug/metabolite transporter (DMT)-like permease